MVTKSNFVVWLTGLPCSGKTTIARRILLFLQKKGCASELLDGDDFRGKFCPHLGFSGKDRDENIEKAAEVARKFSEEGKIVICSFV